VRAARQAGTGPATSVARSTIPTMVLHAAESAGLVLEQQRFEPARADHHRTAVGRVARVEVAALQKPDPERREVAGGHGVPQREQVT